MSAWQIPPDHATCRFGVLFLFASRGRWAFVPDFPARFRLMATFSCCRRVKNMKTTITYRQGQFNSFSMGRGTLAGLGASHGRLGPLSRTLGPGPRCSSACDALVSSSPSVLSDLFKDAFYSILLSFVGFVLIQM